MFSPGAARHQSAAIPQRFEKLEIAPLSLIDTTDTTWPRNSLIFAGSPERIEGEVALTVPCLHSGAVEPGKHVSPWLLEADQTRMVFSGAPA